MSRRSAEEDELEALCARWGVEMRHGTEHEQSRERKQRHKQLKDLCHGARRAHLGALLAAGRARVDAACSDPLLAGMLCEVLGEHRAGSALVGLVVRAGAVSAPIDAHLLRAVGVVEEQASVQAPPPSPPPQQAAADAVPMQVATPPLYPGYPHRPPPRRTESGGWTHTPGCGPGGADTPPWLQQAWRAIFPDWESQRAWDPVARPDGETPNGSVHPPDCPCARPSCPFAVSGGEAMVLSPSAYKVLVAVGYSVSFPTIGRSCPA